MRTPDLDRFIARANFFENYYLASFPTIPHRTDSITGRYVFPFHGWQPADPDVPVLADCLGQVGYVSQLLCDTPHLMRGKTWFDRGFDAARAVRGQEGDTQIARIYWDQMVHKGKHHSQAVCACATHLLDRVLAVLKEDRPYELTDCAGNAVTTAEARRIIREKYHVPDEVRRRRRARNP